MQQATWTFAQFKETEDLKILTTRLRLTCFTLTDATFKIGM